MSISQLERTALDLLGGWGEGENVLSEGIMVRESRQNGGGRSRPEREGWTLGATFMFLRRDHKTRGTMMEQRWKKQWILVYVRSYQLCCWLLVIRCLLKYSCCCCGYY